MSVLGRRHAARICLSRRSSTVESHWSVFKRLLTSFNRPHYEVLINVIDKRLMPKCGSGYLLPLHGVKKALGHKMFSRLGKRNDYGLQQVQYKFDLESFIYA